jgi:predicted kinase
MHRLHGAGLTHVVVRCDVPLQVALERAERRMHETGHVSDATPEIVAEQYRSFEALEELAPGSVLEVDTRQALDAQVAEVTRAVDRRLAPGAPRDLDGPPVQRSGGALVEGVDRR